MLKECQKNLPDTLGTLYGNCFGTLWTLFEYSPARGPKGGDTPFLGEWFPFVALSSSLKLLAYLAGGAQLHTTPRSVLLCRLWSRQLHIEPQGAPCHWKILSLHRLLQIKFSKQNFLYGNAHALHELIPRRDSSCNVMKLFNLTLQD